MGEPLTQDEREAVAEAVQALRGVLADELVKREAAEAERDRLAGRVAELEGKLDEARDLIVKNDERASHRLQRATEVLRFAEIDLARIAEWSGHPKAKPVKAREAQLALERLRSTLAALAGEDYHATPGASNG